MSPDQNFFDTRVVQSLTPSSGRTLHTEINGDDKIEVRESEACRWIHFNGAAVQSAMLLAEPSALVMPYTQTMLAGFLFQPEPTSLLNLGLGGAAFERFFDANFTEIDLTSVESNPAVIQIARDYFFARDKASHQIWQGDAEQYLRESKQTFDMILCDIFGHAGLPEVLVQPDFYRNMVASLNADGVAALNLLFIGEAELLAILQAARANFSALALLDIPEDKNIILLMSKRSTPRIEPGLIQTLSEKLGVDMAALQRQLKMVPGSASQ